MLAAAASPSTGPGGSDNPSTSADVATGIIATTSTAAVTRTAAQTPTTTSSNDHHQQQQGPSGGSSSSGAASPCCDTGRPLVTDPVTGQTVCSCQYERLQAQLQNGLASAGYGPAAAAAAARLAAVSSAVTGVTGLHGVYSAAYPSSDQNPYPSLGMDTTTAFYSSLVS